MLFFKLGRINVWEKYENLRIINNQGEELFKKDLKK